MTIFTSCNNTKTNNSKHSQMNKITASELLGNPEYLAISYGGYRETTRDIQPTIPQLKNDLKILSAMGIKVLRTYNTQYAQASNLLKAIQEMKEENPQFEMYVMLGIWIDCENAWTDIAPNHDAEDIENNTAEVKRAVALANTYPNIVKILAVGNEAMVKWAESYFVQPNIILKWVNHLQELKESGKLNKDLWITSSDNFASWGGGDSLYHCEDLENLIKAVDYVSLHTYPMHDTHYNPVFWGNLESELHLPKTKAIELAMKRAVLYAKKQYSNTVKYIHSIDSTKQVHIGESGWASESSGHYGRNGSKACDEYKEGLYYKYMRKWTNKSGISCFYFEAFDEKWKAAHSAGNSENQFGLFKINGEAKYAVWDLVDKGVFDGLTRNGNAIKKTYSGNLNELLEEVELPAMKQLK
ncbi:MAG: glycosyl hydrolase family 17 [Bacteroidia bacterium]|nr:glycosyl hydrolase family 17 [Bacteroidia bacterium]